MEAGFGAVRCLRLSPAFHGCAHPQRLACLCCGVCHVKVAWTGGRILCHGDGTSRPKVGKACVCMCLCVCVCLCLSVSVSVYLYLRLHTCTRTQAPVSAALPARCNCCSHRPLAASVFVDRLSALRTASRSATASSHSAPSCCWQTRYIGGGFSRQRQRGTERQRDRERDIHTHRHRETERQRQGDVKGKGKKEKDWLCCIALIG